MLASCKTLANSLPAGTRKGAQRWLALAATGDVGHQQGDCVTGSDKQTNSRSGAPTIMAAPRRWLLLAAGASASIHDLVVDKDRRALYRARMAQQPLDIFARATDNLDKGIVVTDAATNAVLHVNKTVTDITGYTKEDILRADTWRELIFDTAKETSAQTVAAIDRAAARAGLR